MRYKVWAKQEAWSKEQVHIFIKLEVGRRSYWECIQTGGGQWSQLIKVVMQCQWLNCTKKQCACHAMMYCTTMYCAMLCYDVLCCTALCSGVLHCAVLCYDVLYCAVLWCTVLLLATSLYSSAAFLTIMLEMPSPTAGGRGAGVLGSRVPLLMSRALCFSSAAILLFMADWSSKYSSIAL